MIGVLGGMGPLATLDFFSKVLAATPVLGEADHVPLLIHSDPRILLALLNAANGVPRNSLLQVRCALLNGQDVRNFKRWYPEAATIRVAA